MKYHILYENEVKYIDLRRKIMFRLCSVHVQNLFRISSNVQNLFSPCSKCSEFSVMFRIYSEFSVMFRICSVHVLMFSNVQTLLRISSTKTGLFRISWLCSVYIFMKNEPKKKYYMYFPYLSGKFSKLWSNVTMVSKHTLS